MQCLWTRLYISAPAQVQHGFFRLDMCDSYMLKHTVAPTHNHPLYRFPGDEVMTASMLARSSMLPANSVAM